MEFPQYYMRMDDDSLLMEKLWFDPFKAMKKKGLDYAWRRDSLERWGVYKFTELVKKHIDPTDDTPFAVWRVQRC